MSDISTTIVPEISDYPNRFEKAQEIVKWLITIQAIEPFKTECVLSSGMGYPIEVGAKFITNTPEYLPFKLVTNGLDVIIERSVFDTGQNGLDNFVCPKCNRDIVAEDWDLANFYETGNSLLICPICNHESELNQYEIEPTWAFGNLGFTFWNWTDLKDEFIKEFERRLGCKVKVVESHI